MKFLNRFKENFYLPYKILVLMYLFFIVFAFIVDSPQEIVEGIKAIILSPDILISDYMAIGGIGAALVNSSITSLLCVVLLVNKRIKPNGSTIMALWLVTGFAFLGKNFFNIWPIIFGVYLFSKYQKENFRNYTLAALLGTALAPIVSQVAFGNIFSGSIGILFGILLGIAVGFIVPPIAAHLIKAHNGYNLYNIGFAAGMIGMLVMSIFKGFGISFDAVLEWHTGSNGLLLVFMLIVCAYLIILGFIYDNNIKENLKALNKEPGRLVSDFYTLYESSSYINMGLLGLFATFFVIIIGGELNGGTICGIFTIIGFGTFGKNLRNVPPVMIGSAIAAFFNVTPMTSPGLMLAILFSTCLAPIAGQFGWPYGILAGFVHVNIVANVGYLHGGMNLYNNGFAGGFVAMLLIPLITTFKKEE